MGPDVAHGSRSPAAWTDDTERSPRCSLLPREASSLPKGSSHGLQTEQTETKHVGHSAGTVSNPGCFPGRGMRRLPKDVEKAPARIVFKMLTFSYQFYGVNSVWLNSFFFESSMLSTLFKCC